MIRSTEDAPLTIAERYATAFESSNLRMQARRTDLDVIIAAGCLDDSFGAALLRLRVEYDLVRGEHIAAEAQLRASEAEARRQKDLVDGNGRVLETAAERSANILQDAEATALTAHALILISLKSLTEVREMMGHFALREAARVKFDRPPSHVLHLSGRVLDVHISPTCRKCQGRGFTGVLQRGERQMACRVCSGSGLRWDAIGKDQPDRSFANGLLMSMSALTANSERRLAGKFRETRDTKGLILEAEAEAARA